MTPITAAITQNRLEERSLLADVDTDEPLRPEPDTAQSPELAAFHGPDAIHGCPRGGRGRVSLRRHRFQSPMGRLRLLDCALARIIRLIALGRHRLHERSRCLELRAELLEIRLQLLDRRLTAYGQV